MTYGINYKITLQFYGSFLPYHSTIEGERYGFKTRTAAKAWISRYVVKPFKADGRINERLYLFKE